MEMDMESKAVSAKDFTMPGYKTDSGTEYPFKLILESNAMKDAQGAEALAKVLELIVDNVYSGIIVCDSDSKILYINKFYADLLQTPREKAVGQHIKNFFPASRLPGVLETGEMELGRKCSLRADIALLVNRIPVKIGNKTVGVVLQTVFKDYAEINELMARLSLLQREVNYYKRGLDSVLSAAFDFDAIIGKNAQLLEAKHMAEKYAKTDGAVLVQGPTGSGKELFAHAIHLASDRRKGAFVCVNCAAIPRDLLESELFGYEEGAFTGARKKGKAGRIELANRGTLFLDEIGDLPLNAQAKLLRVLESGRFERLGALKPVQVDFRLVAATNRDLKSMIQRNEFRADLFYRLNTMSVNIPPLSERTEDIPELARHFFAVLEKPHLKISEPAMQVMKSYAWPGNIRELRNVIERAVSLVEADAIDVDQLPEEVRLPKTGQMKMSDFPDGTLAGEMAAVEKAILERALIRSQNKMVKAAKLLGISRSTLYEKCRRYEIL
jgi:transcriptional regulator with PAS, ATPase and Fis domain